MNDVLVAMGVSGVLLLGSAFLHSRRGRGLTLPAELSDAQRRIAHEAVRRTGRSRPEIAGLVEDLLSASMLHGTDGLTVAIGLVRSVPTGAWDHPLVARLQAGAGRSRLPHLAVQILSVAGYPTEAKRLDLMLPGLIEADRYRNARS